MNLSLLMVYIFLKNINLIERERYMKKIVPFTKDLMFKTKISEITSISLDNTLELNKELVSGEFIVSGTYKVLSENSLEEEFKYSIPVDIAIDSKYDTKNCLISIDDFTYEIINEEKLKVNISVMLDDLDIKEDEIEKIEIVLPNEDIELRNDNNIEINDIIEAKKEIEINKNIKEEQTDNLFNNINNTKEFSVYRVYTVLESDTLDLIYEKFNTTKEILSEYNDLLNISVGSKLIIPSQDE